MTDNKTREAFFADNSDSALVQAIEEARAKLAIPEIRESYGDDALVDELDASLEALLDSGEARARIRTRPLEQVELGIASNPDEDMHSLFTA